MTITKQKNLNRIAVVFLIAEMIFTSVPMPAFAVLYSPGETLNPACAPTDTNCDVITSALKGRLSEALTGTVGITPGSISVTGSSTAFTTELSAGDAIKIGSSVFTVGSIFSNTSLILSNAVATSTATTTGATAYRDPTTLFSVAKGDSTNVFTISKVGLLSLINTLAITGTGTSTFSGGLSAANLATAGYGQLSRLVVTGTATSTVNDGLSVGGNLSLGSLTGFLKATSGFVTATSTLDIGSNTFGTLAVSRGGTGTLTAPSYGKLLLGNVAGGYDLVATSSLGFAPALTGTQGQTITFSATGAQTATSTLYISNAGNIGIGTTTPSAKLAIAGGFSVSSQTQTGTQTNPNLISTGGTILGTAIGGTDTVIKYDTSGTFTPPTGVTNVRVLVVGGGASGDMGVSSGVYGHGGGGGFVTTVDSLTITAGQSIAVTVGAGGIVPTTAGQVGNNGVQSSFGATIANGGTAANNIGAGGDGGDSGKTINGVLTSYAGGADFTWGAAGGAGAGGVSAAATDAAGSVGGIGFSSDITGTSSPSYGTGGDGSGTGTASPAVTPANVGRGGHGHGADVRAGGSGIVIVRFATQSQPTYGESSALSVSNTGATTISGALILGSTSGLLLANTGAVSALATTTAAAGQVLGIQSGALAWVTPTTAATTTINGASGPSFTFNAGTTGTDFSISTSTNTLIFNLPSATSTVRGLLASSDWTVFSNKENALTASTTSAYYRGDKTFQTLNTTAVTEGANLYHTDARARNALSSSALGLTYATSTGVFSLASGYNIPLTASTTNWNTAYSWGNHATAGYVSSSTAFTNNGNSFGGLATLGTTDNNALRIIASSTEAMRILANGNVGIGATNPSNKLSIAGTFGVVTETTTGANPNLISTGGTILGTAIGGTNTVIKYDTSGTFTPPTGVTNVRVLVVGGGASGDMGVSSGVYGHGGGGGFVTTVDSLTITAGQSIAVTVGAGGIVPTAAGQVGNNGVQSSFGATIANGGTAANNIGAGGDGGDSGKTINGVLTSYAGGADFTWGAAGGAGAGGVSAAATDAAGSVGGIGFSSDITGTSTPYGTGGDGSGTGTASPAVSPANEGRGGSGHGADVRAGGSGVVIVRFATVAATTTVNTRLAVDGSGNTSITGNLTLSSLSGLLFVSAGLVSNFATTTATAGQVLGIQNGSLTWVTPATTATTTINGASGPNFTFNTGTTGTDFGISTSTNTLIFNLPSATSTARGLLASSDWTAFSNKENAFAASTTGAYYRGDKTFQTLNTTAVTEGTNLYYTDARTRNALSSSALGLTYATSTGAFSLTSGYNIPLTASTTNWNTFYNTPSNRITVGTGLSWTGNTLTPNYASATTDGIVSTSTQTFAGVKTFSGALTLATTTATKLLTANEGIALASSTPLATSNTLYNQGGTLYWNGSTLGGGSQWTTSGSNLYYNTGNVAIGTSTPSATARLYIEGSAATPQTNPNLISTGGTILGTAIGGTDTVIKYDTSGTFTPPTGVTNVRVLVVGGGASGDMGVSSGVYGHGGGGGFVTTVDSLTITAGQSIAVTVGAGGIVPTAAGQVGNNGVQSSFGATIANGGTAANNIGAGGDGGDSGKTINGVLTSYAGGADFTWGAAGGAGAGGVSAAATDAAGSVGGVGLSSDITGTSSPYGTGGDGSGTGTASPAVTPANVGRGGHGHGADVRAGGSGIVIVRFATVEAIPQSNQALLRVANTGASVSSTLAFFETGASQSCIIAGGSGLSCSSDKNLKKNIAATEGILGNVLTLKPVTYNWRAAEELGVDGFDPYAVTKGVKGDSVGFIAQDVEKLFPGLVRLDPNGNRTLAYDKFAPIIVAALQEQYGGMMGVNVASVSPDMLFATAESLADDAPKSEILNPKSETNSNDQNSNSQNETVVQYLKEKVASGIKIVRELVAERMVAVSGYFKRIFANELCLTDGTGTLVCVTGENLKQIGGTMQQNYESGISSQETQTENQELRIMNQDSRITQDAEAAPANDSVDAPAEDVAPIEEVVMEETPVTASEPTVAPAPSSQPPQEEQSQEPVPAVAAEPVAEELAPAVADEQIATEIETTVE